MSTPTTKVARELIRMACLAPSIHNTQPWAWRLVDAGTIELYADRSRQLVETDPLGRALVISCGAALHHLVVAADGFGLVADVQLMPADGGDDDLLARVHLQPGEATAHGVEMLAALENRTTDRRGFSDWEIPEPRLRHLADVAAGGGAHALPITDPEMLAPLRSLLEEARAAQAANPRIAEELGLWIDHAPDDGVPSRSATPPPTEGVARPPGRFNRGTSEQSRTGGRGHADAPGDALMLVFTAHDDEEAWLAAGQSLSALWIRATLDGMSVTPETQVIEVDRTRRHLRRVLLDDLGRPQVLVHVGWQESTRPAQEPTPRRALDDVLRP